MDYLVKKARPLQKTWGGKAYLARKIINLFPDHTTYVEPFAGGLNVALNKPAVDVEVAADANPGLVNLYRVVGSPVYFPVFAELVARAGKDKLGLRYNESTFQLAKLGVSALAGGAGQCDPVAWAVMYLVARRFSSGGLGETFAWTARQRGGLPGDENAWENLKKDLPVLHERLRLMDVRLVDRISSNSGNTVIDLINGHAGQDTLFYLDPPYPAATRTSKDSYGEFEMTDQEHLDLLAAVVGVQAKGVFLSTYWNDLYNRVLQGAPGWDYTFYDLPNHSGRGVSKQRRREILWFRV